MIPRCGDHDCNLPQHRPAGRLPGVVTYRPMSPRREWDRRDPDYDDSMPQTVWEAIVLVPVAMGIFLAFVVLVGLAFAVLAPAP